MTRIRSIAIRVARGLVLVLTGCGNGPPDLGAAGGAGGGAPVGKAAVTLPGTPAAKVDATADLKFNPNTTTVKTGDVILWTDSSNVPHNVTFDSQQYLTSQTLQQGDTWAAQFTVAGTYAYHCTIHPGMDGTITVSG
jgi:plastocyanin